MIPARDPAYNDSLRDWMILELYIRRFPISRIGPGPQGEVGAIVEHLRLGDPLAEPGRA